jgi:hypothetical protein
MNGFYPLAARAFFKHGNWKSSRNGVFFSWENHGHFIFHGGGNPLPCLIGGWHPVIGKNFQ